MRGIAVFEGLKGCAALAVGLGLASLFQHDLRHLVLELVGHFGLDPTQHFSVLLLRYADWLNGTPLDTLEGMLFAYASVRFAEAYGLWREKAWAEWLGALSGGLYVPFEWHHLWHAPSPLGAGVLALNMLIVGFLALQLWRRRSAARQNARTPSGTP